MYLKKKIHYLKVFSFVWLLNKICPERNFKTSILTWYNNYKEKIYSTSTKRIKKEAVM